jgi:hypothetical protein
VSAPGTKRVIVALLACELVPVPFLDTVAQNLVRRAWVDWYARRYGPVPADLSTDQALSVVRRVLTHPLRAIATKLFPPLVLWEVWVLIRDTRALGAQLERGW